MQTALDHRTPIRTLMACTLCERLRFCVPVERGCSGQGKVSLLAERMVTRSAA